VAKRHAKASGGSFKVSNSMESAFQNADIVYPKSWAPFKVMERRTALLEKNDHAGLKGLEQECLAQNAKFKSWECDEAKMKLTKGGKAVYMHCLPADITDVSCKAGEVSASVFEKARIGTYKEAGYKPFVIAAMIAACSKKNPAMMRAVQSRKTRPVSSGRKKGRAALFGKAACPLFPWEQAPDVVKLIFPRN
jgi:ornithine carbamoyltransferase